MPGCHGNASVGVTARGFINHYEGRLLSSSRPICPAGTALMVRRVRLTRNACVPTTTLVPSGVGAGGASVG